ncbi:DUF2505 domain-containing protein [Actinokineospora sp. NBRC 105648]|uniref:DUF2505 domain-containing protein n=1 Tax=Actinokineospora sp. NBRC 105648 TaxID=3032206 RepID=UPI0024A03B70|nr:DUF2505 domain-containing protein [Actinokineospora sp. NBRC 105648]GLZ38245.1 hypothetical protein Acsp05_18690 [Actinokineospora sp. NBRC 105648]
MASRIEHRAEFTAPAATVHARLVDRAFLEERLRVLGGKDAALVSYTETGGAVEYRLRQGIDAARLPSIVRSLVKGDLVVERTETWRPDGDAFAGTTAASVAGVPGEIKGTYRLADAAGGSALRTDAEVKVRVPLIGGKIESVIAEQVRRLLASEAEFAATRV